MRRRERVGAAEARADAVDLRRRRRPAGAGRPRRCPRPRGRRWRAGQRRSSRARRPPRCVVTGRSATVTVPPPSAGDHVRAADARSSSRACSALARRLDRLLRRVPAAHDDLVDLLDAGDARPEAEQVRRPTGARPAVAARAPALRKCSFCRLTTTSKSIARASRHRNSQSVSLFCWTKSCDAAGAVDRARSCSPSARRPCARCRRPSCSGRSGGARSVQRVRVVVAAGRDASRRRGRTRARRLAIWPLTRHASAVLAARRREQDLDLGADRERARVDVLQLGVRERIRNASGSIRLSSTRTS